MSALRQFWMVGVVAPVLALAGPITPDAQALPAIDLKAAKLRAHGDAVALRYSVTCARSFRDAFLSSYVTQKQGRKRVTASDSTYLTCTGEPQRVTVTASAYGSRSF